jgi:hypothetical protein
VATSIASPAGSTYSIESTGYGSITLGAGNLGDVSALGVYMVDPALDINDPNNTTSPDVGGALVVDLDAGLSGGMGVITPQTDTTQADFAGSYAAGFQDLNAFPNTACNSNGSLFICEFDMLGPFSMTATTGPLSTATIGADDSDPFGTWSGTPGESTGDTWSSTPLNVSPGYYSMSVNNTTPNQLAATVNGVAGYVDADIYQASGDTLYWLEFDDNGVFLGAIEAQGSLTSMPAAKRPGSRSQKRQQSGKHGGTAR